jgi:hypothetical protein
VTFGTQVKRHMVFSPQDHPNTLAPLGPGQLWVVLHNLGEVGWAGPGVQSCWGVGKQRLPA